jgi:hypothetical protein
MTVFIQGPGGVWCDVDVVEFSYYGTPATTPKEQIYTELVEGLRGNDPSIGSGSQVHLIIVPVLLLKLAWWLFKFLHCIGIVAVMLALHSHLQG